MAVIAPLDVEYGNLSHEQAKRMRDAADVFIDDHTPGCTEPWIVEVLVALLKATGIAHPTVLETGGFRGTTSEWLVRAIKKMGGGRLIVAELDAQRAHDIQSRLSALPLGNCVVTVLNQDAVSVIRNQPEGSLAFAFVDDDHEMEHVRVETEYLIPKMQRGGIITYHDVFGRCDLQQVVRRYGGYCLDIPRAGPAGGLGIIQC